MWVKRVEYHLVNLDMVYDIDIYDVFGNGIGARPTGAEVRGMLKVDERLSLDDYKVLFAGTEDECKRFVRYLEIALCNGVVIFDYSSQLKKEAEIAEQGGWITERFGEPK